MHVGRPRIFDVHYTHDGDENADADGRDLQWNRFGYEQKNQHDQNSQKPFGFRRKAVHILDQNALADGKSFCRIGAFRISPDHTKLAYSVDPDGTNINRRCGALHPELMAETVRKEGADIGLAFDDADVARAGFDPSSHRAFLLDYFTGEFEGSSARGVPFARNEKSGDARISGSLASLAGLEAALEAGDEAAIDHGIERILLLHGMILSFGGIPLLYYGDEIGTLNDYSYLEDEAKAGDSRWLHRPDMDWSKAELRHRRGTVEQRLFDGVAGLIAVRKQIPAFADFNNRELLDTGNPHLFVFRRGNPFEMHDDVLVVANFDDAPQSLDLSELGNRGSFGFGELRDLCTGEAPVRFRDRLVVPPRRFYWLSARG